HPIRGRSPNSALAGTRVRAPSPPEFGLRPRIGYFASAAARSSKLAARLRCPFPRRRNDFQATARRHRPRRERPRRRAPRQAGERRRPHAARGGIGMARLFALLLLSLASAAWAQSYPNRPVRLVVPFGPGAPDTVARLLAAALQSQMGQAFVVENKPGANGIIGTQTVTSA